MNEARVTVRVSPGLPLYQNLEGIGLRPQKWAGDYLNVAPRYLDITSNIFCTVEGSNQGLERIGRERIAFMVRTDEPVRTDKFDYAEDEDLSINEFEFQHLFGGWHLACTKLDSAFIYALIVDDDELLELQELSPGASRAEFLHDLEQRHIRFSSPERPPVSQVCFQKEFPKEPVVVALSQFVVIRPTHSEEMLAVNYVNRRAFRRPGRERGLLEALAKSPLQTPLQELEWQRALEKLHRHGIVMVVEVSSEPRSGDILPAPGEIHRRANIPLLG